MEADALQPLRAELVDTALVKVEEIAGFNSPYWHFHPTLPYAARPEQVPDPDAAEQRFIAVYRSVGNEARNALFGADPAFGMALLGYEEANYRAAIARAFRRGARQVGWALADTLAPYQGRVFDPCCGSGGMFVQSETFVAAHGGRIGDISVYGQESNPTTWRMAKMNLAIRGIDGNLGQEHADSFHRDLHKDLRADYMLANPPFNDSDWGGERLRDDARWQYGVPPAGNANFAWVQHFIAHLAPDGLAGFVLANGSMSSNTSGEGEIRKQIIEADLVDCMVALPGNLFYSTQIPVCLWFLARRKRNGRFPDRRGETLFIDARKLGVLIDRVHRDLTDEEIAQIAGSYHAWRGDAGAGEYADVPGFCKRATTEEIRSHGFVLTPGRYVGAAEVDEDDEPFAAKMERLTTTLAAQMTEGAQLDAALRDNLRALGYDLTQTKSE